MKIKAIRREIYEILWVAMAVIKIIVYGSILTAVLVIYSFVLMLQMLFGWLFKKK